MTFSAKFLITNIKGIETFYNLEKEEKTVTDSTKADGALGFFTFVSGKLRSDIRVVIELKDAKD